ncbi:MAG: sirohydrochlorin chelatase [Alphaproteobacteria bacterium]
MSEPAILLCGHGSRDIEAIREFEALAAGMRTRLPGRRIDHGFLEFARPTLGTVLHRLRDEGAREIHALPGMLFAAGHAKNDIPSVLNDFQAAHADVTVRYGRDLAIDPLMLRAARERIEAAERATSTAIERADSVLLVIGRGTNDPDANSNVAKVARLLAEGMGYGWGAAGYSGVAHPRTDAALGRLLRLGFRRIVVFPYFLFTGVLVKRIYAAADEAAAAQSKVEIVKAPYLNDHPLVLQAFNERLDEIAVGRNLMNCQMCKYREQIIGYERDLGAPQAGHHHHVEGIGTDADHAHHHGHDGHHHHHGHHHHDDHHHHHHEHEASSTSNGKAPRRDG